MITKIFIFLSLSNFRSDALLHYSSIERNVNIVNHGNPMQLFATCEDYHHLTRRNIITNSTVQILASSLFLSTPSKATAKIVPGEGNLFEINDPLSYPALVYTPKTNPREPGKKLPVLFVLHGAAKNELDVWNLANIQGEHSGLAPSLLASGKAPPELYENFIVIIPYSKGKQSFYEEPRNKLLQFMGWSISSEGGGAQGVDVDRIDRDKKFLFGFSDGATLGIELMTTQKFAAGIFCAYGFTGQLPALALERLKGLPIWIFHSADDVIFPVRCSDQLVKDLRANNGGNEMIRYTRFDKDQEGFSGSVRGHSTGITASKSAAIYEWLLSM